MQKYVSSSPKRGAPLPLYYKYPKEDKNYQANLQLFTIYLAKARR
jgi:hypothetical protein